MKIRIKGNSVRLRLTQSEVNNFKEKSFVEERTFFGKDKFLVYALRKEVCGELMCKFSGSRIEVCVPQQLANTWVNSDMVGFSNETDPKDENSLNILVEKDFACLKERIDEDERDMFPHPDVETHKC